MYPQRLERLRPYWAMMTKLNPQDKARLNRASPVGIRSYTTGLVGHFANDTWLDSNNIYRRNAGKQVTKDKKHNKAKNSTDLGEYVAASVPLHLVDGWSYFGQALYAHVCGLPEIALHLGYYSETRAAMSLLAGQGIGIFARHHCVVEASGKIGFLPSEHEILGTHQAVWAYFDYWLQSRTASVILGEVIRPYTIPLEEWIQELPCTAGGTWNRVAASLIRGFGLDLKRLAKDRGLRNRASYDPSELLGYHRPHNGETVEFVLDTIRTLEPSGAGGGFGLLDQQLLGQAIELQFQASTGSTPLDAFGRYKSEVEDMLRNVGAGRLAGPATRQLLMDEKRLTVHDSLVRRASAEGDTGDPRPLLSRAAILLRMATGSAYEFMRATNVDLEMTGSWWQKKALDTGLWRNADTPDEMMDLWADVDYALEQLEGWDPEQSVETRDLFATHAFAVWEMMNLGRLALIGLSS